MVFPPGPLMFNALNTTPFDAVKVVILGQDPYHGPGQAHGLSFSGTRRRACHRPRWSTCLKEINTDLGLLHQ